MFYEYPKMVTSPKVGTVTVKNANEEKAVLEDRAIIKHTVVPPENRNVYEVVGVKEQ